MRWELHREAWILCYVTCFKNVSLLLTNIQMDICVYTLISHLKNLPSLPKVCWCHCISEEWLGLIYHSDFHLSPTWAQAFSSACYELSKFLRGFRCWHFLTSLDYINADLNLPLRRLAVACKSNIWHHEWSKFFQGSGTSFLVYSECSLWRSWRIINKG